jgi:GNAT superfamily N-acetyltransferase
MVNDSQLSLQFSDQPPKKLLRNLRKAAGWSTHNMQDHAASPQQAKIQWLTVKSQRAEVGVARLELAPPEFCYVADLLIASEYRGQGIGHWFMHRIEQYCGNMGIQRLLLQPEPAAMRFYESLHFVSDPYVTNFWKKEISPLQKKTFRI